VKELATDVWREIREDGLMDTAASVAFWLLLSLPAALLAVLSSVSLLGPELATELEDVLLEFVDRTFTDESEGVRAAVTGLFDQPRAGLLSIALATAILTLSGAFAGLIRGLDVAYDIVEPRGFIRLRLAALGLAIGTLFVITISTLMWSRSESIGIPVVVRLIVALTVLIIWAATIFHIAPHHHTPWRYDLPGAVFAAVGWLLLSFGYGWYIRLAGGGNELVGVAGAALLGLTWLWLACLVLLGGAELNEILADRANVIAPHTPWRRKAVGLYNRRQASSADDGFAAGTDADADGSKERGDRDAEP
jgi:membrane protein